MLKYVRHDESLLPMPMGSPARTPDYARSAWGLPPFIDEETVVKLYGAEWAEGNEWQLELVSQASKRGGFGDNAALLRQKTAEVVRVATEECPVGGELLILDVGAGPGVSALTVWQELSVAVQSRVRFLLLDPSRGSLESARKAMEKHGISHEIICDVDLNMGQHIAEGRVDILIGVAAIHHHSAIPFDLYCRMLKPGGIAVFADWHNSIWEDPARVYQFLEAFDWPRKKEGLKNWLEVYPQAGRPKGESYSPADRQANLDIIRFWQGYLEIIRERDVGPNAIWPLEGHRPVERYVEEMQKAGFVLESSSIKKILERGILASNPHQLLPDSRLLMATVGEKRTE